AAALQPRQSPCFGCGNRFLAGVGAAPAVTGIELIENERGELGNHESESLDYCGCRCFSTACLGSRLRMERISRTPCETVWLEHFRGYANFHYQHFCAWSGCVLWRALAESERTQNRRSYRWAPVRWRSLPR